MILWNAKNELGFAFTNNYLMENKRVRIVTVAPHVGAWIETHPGLSNIAAVRVAPHVGAWIETDTSACFSLSVICRAPRGRVD